MPFRIIKDNLKWKNKDFTNTFKYQFVSNWWEAFSWDISETQILEIGDHLFLYATSIRRIIEIVISIHYFIDSQNVYIRSIFTINLLNLKKNHVLISQYIFKVHISFCFLGPHMRHMEVPRLGVESELQLPAYTTATAKWDLSSMCNLHHSSWQC